jgi:hypothetical protein
MLPSTHWKHMSPGRKAIYGDFDGQRFVMSIVDTSISGAEKLNLKDATAKVEAILTAR